MPRVDSPGSRSAASLLIDRRSSSASTMMTPMIASSRILQVAVERPVRLARHQPDDQDDQRVHVELARPPVRVHVVAGELLDRAAVARAESAHSSPRRMACICRSRSDLAWARALSFSSGVSLRPGVAAGLGPRPLVVDPVMDRYRLASACAALGRRPALARLRGRLALGRGFRGLRALGILGLAFGRARRCCVGTRAQLNGCSRALGAVPSPRLGIGLLLLARFVITPSRTGDTGRYKWLQLAAARRVDCG